MKTALKIIIVLAALLVGVFFLLRTPDTDRDYMVQIYTNDASRFVSDGQGGKIHYRDEGNRNGPAIVLLHGSNSSLHTWEALVKQLGSDYRLISLDLYGHGLTGPSITRDYSAAANIAAVTKVLDKVGVEKAVWAGNSMGGWLSWRAALLVPDRVAGLVLIDAAGVPKTAITGEDEQKLYLGARLANSALGQWLLPQITPRWLVEQSVEQNYANPSKVTDELTDRYWELLRYPGNRDATIDRAKTDRQADKWNDIAEIKVPVLLIWGSKDTVIPLNRAEAFKSALPQALLSVHENAGHLPMEEVPDQVAADMAGWLRDLNYVKAIPRPLSQAPVLSAPSAIAPTS